MTKEFTLLFIKEKNLSQKLSSRLLFISHWLKPDYIATPMGKAVWKEYMCMSYSYMPLDDFIGSIVIGEHERGGFKMTMALPGWANRILEWSVRALFSVTTSSSMLQISLSGLDSFLRVNLGISICLEKSECSFTKTK